MSRLFFFSLLLISLGNNNKSRLICVGQGNQIEIHLKIDCKILHVKGKHKANQSSLYQAVL